MIRTGSIIDKAITILAVLLITFAVTAGTLWAWHLLFGGPIG